MGFAPLHAPIRARSDCYLSSPAIFSASPSSGSVWLSPWLRHLSSALCDFSVRWLTTTRSGMPSRSASLNLTPADSVRSSNRTSTPLDWRSPYSFSEAATTSGLSMPSAHR